MGHFRALLISGTFFVTFGFMMTSISTQYWHILLAQGVSIGFGTCCLSIPSIALVPPYFTTKRARAMGLATVGSSLGGTLYPLIFQRLQPRIGFGWAVRVMGFMVFATCCYSIAVMRPRQKPKLAIAAQMTPVATGKKRRPLDSLRSLVRSAKLKERSYLIYCLASFLSNVAYLEPIYYLQSYALTHGMQGQDLANYLLAILNAASIPGRIVPSFVADKAGALNTFIAICFLTGATNLYWISVSNAAGNIAFAVLSGFFSGGVVSLAPVVLAGITVDLGCLGTRLGAVAVLKGLGSLIGAPAAGAILGATGKYLGIQLFAACSILLTAFFLVVLWFVLRREKAKSSVGSDGSSGEIR